MDIETAPHNRAMDKSLRDNLIDLFDAAPAGVGEFRAIIRRLVEHRSLSIEEAEIMAWDDNGRSAADQDRLAAQAWDFNEEDGLACRRRLFAGFVTTNEPTDGYGADYLIDFALGSGIPADDVYAAMTTFRTGSL